MAQQQQIASRLWTLAKLNRDENVFYLGLAVLWFFNTPVIVTILPYATFSLFHLITYFRTNILQTFFPQSRQSHSSRESHSSRAPKLSQYEKWANSASKFISTWVHQNYDQAMRIVSFFEVVVITSMLIWNVLTFYMNKFTTQTFRDVGNYLDRLLLPPSANPNIPPFVTKAYQHAKSAVIWAGLLSTTTSSPTTPTSVGSSSSNASFSSGPPGPALPSLRPTPEHIPVNNFNSQEVETYLNTGWKEAVERHYANSSSEPDKTEMYNAGKAWGPRGGPVWGHKPHLMANGNDFFTELRKSSPNVQVSNAQPATANMKRMSSQRRTKVFGRNRDNNGMFGYYHQRINS
ncbi:11952_t:CDS:10 [Diversispora eburnea]|uniref:11952_t:CDS:1 n=1 Tax=Diversispora eburnea TaxID=1213867 RepID=A0A9N9CEN8_9GLOM|nr:11952_t:CDS:10 [Diversispora eburnea]